MSNLKELTSLPLWTTFCNKATPEQISLLSKIIEQAIERLETIPNTFPTYTLHNYVHSENIVKRMGELLGERANDLTSLEAFILISSAYLHDIGMSFSEEEKNNIDTEPDFEKFINKYSEALLQYEKNGRKPTVDLTEWYCRWAHPDRVFHYLHTIASELKWGTISLIDAIGTVCSSHGKGAEIIREDDFSISFIEQADLKFCAILLRLADILDFDNSRSPEELYKYLGLKKRETRRTTISDIEWRKHLDSDGFVISTNKISIVAGPDEPAVEYDIREFIKIIESELSKCANLLRFCSDKWRNYLLPSKEIETSNIKSKNYKYGDFKFSLEQNEVINLLMGENLYSDQFIFIRELLQNAIDTTRQREYVERSQGNLTFKAKPIKFTTWNDEESNQWVRIDDFGMGMSEDQIMKYLLKIGKSYYTSPEFEADLIKFSRNNNSPLKPISMFGIGILSCFIIGDKVEISTRRFLPIKEEDSVRLSLSGIHSFYTYQSNLKHHIPKKMPNKPNQDEGFRLGDEYGTSIAVRISPQKNTIEFDLSKTLEEHICDVSIPVYVDNDNISTIKKSLYEKEWIDKTIEIKLTNEDKDEIKKNINQFTQNKDYTLPEELTLFIIPVNFNNTSDSPKLKGQGVVIHLNIPTKKHGKEISYRYDKLEDYFSIELHPNNYKNINGKLTKHSSYSFNIKYTNYSSGVNTLNLLYKTIEIDSSSKILYDNLRTITKKGDDTSLVSHNGIRVSKNSRIRILRNNNYYFQGAVSLWDELRPSVTISRDEIKDITWATKSHIALCFSRELKKYPNIDLSQLNIFDSIKNKVYTLNEILEDALLNKWIEEPIIPTNIGIASIQDILKNKTEEIEIYKIGHVRMNNNNEFMEYLIATLIQLNLNVSLRFDRIDSCSVVVNGAGISTPIKPGQKIFPPLFFIKYEKHSYLKFFDKSLNESHPFSQWLINNALLLNEKCPSFLKDLTNNIDSEISKKEIESINTILNKIELMNIGISPIVKISMEDIIESNDEGYPIFEKENLKP